MSHSTGLTIRQHSRESVELPIEFVVGDTHAAQVRLSASRSALHEQTIRGTTVDISAGGMGLITDHYVPRMCEGIVRILAPGTVPTTEDGPLGDILFEHIVKVRRISMASHDPTYSIGVSFLEPETTLADQIEQVKKRYTRRGEAPRGESSDA